MMLITAIVVPSRVPVVRRALGLFGVQGATQERLYAELRPGVKSWVPRVRLDVLSTNADTPDLVRVIRRAATGSDLQLWVVRVDHLVRIRTGEVGLDAI